jgi:transposase-like protein
MRAALPPEKKAALLAEYDAGGVSHAELAAKYGVKKQTISTWMKRRTHGGNGSAFREGIRVTNHCAFGRRASALQLVRDLEYKYAVGEDSA